MFWQESLVGIFILCQILYFLSFSIDLYFYTRPIDWVHTEEARDIKPEELPYIVLLYPVYRELKETMRTTFLGLEKLDYPSNKFRVVGIPNKEGDELTVRFLLELQSEFSFLTVMQIPPPTDPLWYPVWQAWDENPQAYWWHTGKRALDKALPRKKTRQMVYAFYHLVRELGTDFLLDYIDADSVPPPDHFRAAAAGIRKYDVLQSTNVAGNLLATYAASWHSQDHMAWDGDKYPHLSAHGKHPFWVLGKGLFFKASDLVLVGCFNPWFTIEDPEIGMRLWANGKKIGIIANPLIEEVPATIMGGITQRKRWICGFFQSLGAPLKLMGMSWKERMLARFNLLPCLLLMVVNALGIPIGIWALVTFLQGSSPIPLFFVVFSTINLVSYITSMSHLYFATWKRTALVLPRLKDRLRYMWRINPVFLWIYWTIWIIPICMGVWMYLGDRGQEWDRTEKIDANHHLVRERIKS